MSREKYRRGNEPPSLREASANAQRLVREERLRVASRREGRKEKKEKRDNEGIIICRDDRNWENFANRIHQVITEVESFKRHLICVNRVISS